MGKWSKIAILRNLLWYNWLRVWAWFFAGSGGNPHSIADTTEDEERQFRSNSVTPHEPRFARELPTIPPLLFRRGEGRGEGSDLGFRSTKRVRMPGSSLPNRGLTAGSYPRSPAVVSP
jgi:hypothetical protein